MSLIESAPATMPATSAGTFNPGLAPSSPTPSHGTWPARPTQLEPPGPPAEPTLHTTPNSDAPKHLSHEQKKEEDSSVRSSSDGCAKVKA
jgi:hypothetical protein